MTHAHTLIRHRDIQAWVTDRQGMPAMVRGHNRFGELRSRLAIKFAAARASTGPAGIEQGVSPVSWTAWLAELDRRQLALRVSDDGETDYELIERRSLN